MACVYRYRACDQIVYIGRAQSLEKRNQQHKYDPWWKDYQELILETIDGLSDAEADMLETYFIARHHPKENVAKTSWGTAKPIENYDSLTWQRYVPPDPKPTATRYCCEMKDECGCCGCIKPTRQMIYIDLAFKGENPFPELHHLNFHYGLGYRVCLDCYPVVFSAIDKIYDACRDVFVHERSKDWIPRPWVVIQDPDGEQEE